MSLFASTLRARHPGLFVVLVSIASIALTALTPFITPTPAGAQTSVGSTSVAYQPPVSGPVVDGWRPPPGPYGAGNRGVDYGVTVGETIGATADGVVSFAGSVAGTKWVVIRHADGRRSSLGPLASVVTGAGSVVAAGRPVGTAATTAIHWGVREADVYVDPTRLLPVPTPGKGRLRLTG